MGGNIYGYIRVSTKEQNEARQAAKRLGIDHHTFRRWAESA